MANSDFFNRNAHRDFPFTTNPVLTGGNLLSNLLMLDAGFLLGGNSQFDSDLHSVWLYEIIYSAPGDVTFRFKTDAPGLGDDYYIEGTAVAPWSFGDTIELKATHAVSYVEDDDLASGWLVLGPDDDYDAQVTYGTHTFTTSTIEPSLIQSLAGSVVVDIEVWQQPLTQWSPYDTSVSAAFQDYYLVADGITGTVTFKDGYNVSVLIDGTKNAINFFGGIGAGLGVFCDWGDFDGFLGDRYNSVPGSFPGGTWSTWISLCNELVAVIGGSKPNSGGQFLLSGTAGLKVTPHDTNPNMLVMGQTRSDLFCEVSP